MAGAQENSVSVKYNYDVFFSFSHQDLNSTNHLYTALVDAGFRTFRDGDSIERSADIKLEVRKAIERSKFSVIVLSKSYASSTWCLDQLVMIIEEKKNLILPVFYDVDPVEVGNQIGRIGDAFSRFEDELKVEIDPQKRKKLMDKIKEWSEALSFAADVQGFVLKNQTLGDESMLIAKIIEAVEEKVKAVDEDFLQMEAETECELLNQEEPSSLVEDWTAAEISLINIEELPENPNCPFLVKLFFQQSDDLTEIPDSFFESMPLLQVLDLSNTSIKTLPRSIASLVELRQFFLRGCVLLTELPPEIGELGNLEVFDLEGTELIYLPKEIGRLLKLKCLKVSLYRCADNYIERKGIEAIIPRATLSKFSSLNELSIVVDPDCEWWDAEVEAVIDELPQLRNLGTLNLYFPTLELLQKFLQLPSDPYRNLSNFRLTVGRNEQHIISSLPCNLQSNFEKLDKCLIYVNGKGNADVIGNALENARALFLDRQWAMEKLSEFKTDEMRQLNFCLVVECNEMSTIVDGGDFYQELDNVGKPVLGSLRYLSVHYMKNLQSIWRGPIVSHCLSCLEILALHTCPELTTILNLALLRNLVNLKELIVENCPKVKILVSAYPSRLEADSYFLPALKKILIVDLPELFSVSGGLRIGPKLESIAFSNCPMLKNLSPMDNVYSKFMHEIKDESEWLNELDSSSSEIDYLQRVFVPLTSYDDFAEQIKLSGKPLYQLPSQNQVHRVMCTDLMKLVERVAKIFPEIEAARPRTSGGIHALVLLNSGIEKAKLLVQYCSESSKFYLALTGDVILSRCKKSRNLLEQSLSQIQNMVPVQLAAEISRIIVDLRATTFSLDPTEEEAGKAIKTLIHQYASVRDSIEESAIKAIQFAASRLHITSHKALLMEKRSIKKLLDKVGDSGPKKQILLFLLLTLKKYEKSITKMPTESYPVHHEDSFSLSSDPFMKSGGAHSWENSSTSVASDLFTQSDEFDSDSDSDSWENSSISVASLSRSFMNDLYSRVDLSNVSLGSLDTNRGSDSLSGKINDEDFN